LQKRAALMKVGAALFWLCVIYASTATRGAPANISALAKSAYFSKFLTNF